MDATKLPALIIWLLGGICTGSMINLIISTNKTRFINSDLGRLVLLLLIFLLLSSIVSIAANVGLAFYSQWFQSTSLPKQLFGACQYSLGVLNGGANLWIALERYWIICHETALPRIYLFTAFAHAAVTVSVMIWAYASHEAFTYKIPGDQYQRNVCIVFIMQYLMACFGGITYLYYQTYQHCAAQLTSMQTSATAIQNKANATMKRVVVNCILMMVAFLVCYSIKPITVVYAFFDPYWQEPVALDVVENCLNALDGIVTPLIVLHLNRDLMSQGGKGNSSILTRKESKKIKSASMNESNRSISKAASIV